MKENTTKSPKQKTLECLVSIIIGLVIGLVLKNFVFMNTVVPTESMETTVMANDRLVGYRLAYAFSEPKRGDVITFDSPEVPGTTYLKRIIGLPGETLQIVDGKVFINNSSTALEEDYINPAEEPIGDFGPVTIPHGCYFVMGDNRNHSLDSRYWETTYFIEKEAISSKIIFKYLPKLEKIS